MPPKSGCWFCPYKRREEFFALKEKEPYKFKLLLQLEKETGHNIRKGNTPLSEIEHQERLFLDAPECEGSCFT